jgi:hypothetical protein
MDQMVHSLGEARDTAAVYACEVVDYVDDGPGGGWPIVTIQGSWISVAAFLYAGGYDEDSVTTEIV